MRLKPIIYAVVTSTLFFAACKKKETLKGIDKDALFATPTASEIDAVNTMWGQRNLVPDDVAIEETHKLSEKLDYYIISFRLNGVREYAGVVMPVSTKPLPVMVYIGGFGLLDLPVNSINLQQADTAQLPFIFVLPSLKGQFVNFKFNGQEYNSAIAEGERHDAFDGATDDVIACINAVGALFVNADTLRVMARGGSRGGTVALLLAERDRRVKLATAVAFTTDFVAQTADHEDDATYKYQFLEGLIKRTSTVQETRQKMIASSPLFFYKSLPRIQMHVGENDKITPAAEARKLVDAMTGAGLKDRAELFIYSGRDHDNIAKDNNEMERRISTFFSSIW